MRVVFMGTPEFAVPSLEALAEAFEVTGVVTQPDRPRGRGQKVSPPPVKAMALALGLPVLQPLRLKEPGFLEALRAMDPQVVAVAAYARLLPREVLELPPLGCVNLHPSKLPLYRGALPIQSCLIHGDASTAVTTFLMGEGYDTGDLLRSLEVPLTGQETGGELSERLAGLGAALLVETLKGLEEGRLVPTPQVGEALYTRPLRKEDLQVDWAQPARRVRDFARALAPEPGASACWEGLPVKIGRSEVVEGVGGAPGEVLSLIRGRGPVVATSEGGLLLLELKPAGKGWMDGWAFAQGRQVIPGSRFSPPR